MLEPETIKSFSSVESEPSNWSPAKKENQQLAIWRCLPVGFAGYLHLAICSPRLYLATNWKVAIRADFHSRWGQYLEARFGLVGVVD